MKVTKNRVKLHTNRAKATLLLVIYFRILKLSKVAPLKMIDQSQSYLLVRIILNFTNLVIQFFSGLSLQKTNDCQIPLFDTEYLVLSDWQR